MGQLSPRNMLTIGVGSVSYVTLVAFSAIIPNHFGFGSRNKIGIILRSTQ